MQLAHDIFARKLRLHSPLSQEEVGALRQLPAQERHLGPNEDIVRQGDRPRVAVIVLEGMLARYHTLASGQRQYLSFHIAGDMPDAQGLFLDVMDHSVCAIDHAKIVLFPHGELLSLFQRRPVIGFAIWRETLIDAAIFREAITNNSSRSLLARLAHFFCEQYYRAVSARAAQRGACRLPLSQTQIGEALGVALVSINRALQSLRSTGCADLRDGQLIVSDWPELKRIGQFDPTYLHLRRHPEL
jgi:CRP-like cAMP-binding protein